MSDTLVRYVIDLKDNLSGGVDAARGHVNQLESAVGGVKTALGALGVAFGVFEIASFIKGGVEKYHELEQATSKVEANLKSTSGIAGLGMEELGKFAKELSSKIQASRSEVTDMQSQLLTFPAITKDVFQQSMGLVADIAAQTGHGLSETAIMYGKALSSPVDGLQKMMRYGVMFTAAEKERISHLQASGHLIEAQKVMMDSIAHSGYGGVAEALLAADPIRQFNKMLGAAQVQIGEYATEILKSILPALLSMAEGLKEIVRFIKDHSEALGVLVGIYLTYKSVIIATTIAEMAQTAIKKISAAWTIAMTTYEYTRALGLGVLTAAQYALNTAMALNPVGLVIAAIVALGVVIYEAWKHFEGFREIISGTWEVIKSFIVSAGDMFGGLGKIIYGAFFMDAGQINKGLNQIIDSVGDAGRKMGIAWNKGKNSAAESFANDMYGSDAEKAISLTAKGGTGDGTKPKMLGDEIVAAPKTKAEGQKTINIHVAYNAPLIQGFTISTTHMKEGFDELKTKVTAILTGATRDSLMVADN